MPYLIGLSWSTSRSPGPGLVQLPVLHVDLLINHNCTKLVQFGILNEEYLHQDLTISGTKATRRQLAATREMPCLQFTHPETIRDNNKLRPHLKSFLVRVGCGWRGKVFLRLQLDLMSALVYKSSYRHCLKTVECKTSSTSGSKNAIWFAFFCLCQRSSTTFPCN